MDGWLDDRINGEINRRMDRWRDGEMEEWREGRFRFQKMQNNKVEYILFIVGVRK